MRTHLSLLMLALGIGCRGPMVTSSGNEPLDFNTAAFPTGDESVMAVGAETGAIYQEVLKFYRPAGGKKRWIDRTLLPTTATATDGGTLDSSQAAALVESLGESYCLLERRTQCPAASGGTLRMSPVYQVSSQHARVVVRYTSVDPYAPATTNTQVFLVEREDGQWKIRSRGPVRDPS
jgi:hypothetical protein